MTCDNAGAMDVMVRSLKSDLQSFCPLPLNGEFFQIRCCAHILNLIVQSGMTIINASVLKVRAAVNYIAGSDQRLSMFDNCVVDSQCNFQGKLKIDCPTRWNSTFKMLKRAIDAKKVVQMFCNVCPSIDFSLSDEEWATVEFVCRFLDPFNSITKLFSDSDYPTANLYFPFVLAIEKLLVLGHNHEVHSIRSMASVMLVKYEKYWSDYSTVLAIAMLLDPRYKTVVIRRALGSLYVDEEVDRRMKVIREAFIELYKFYDQSPNSSSASTSAPTRNRRASTSIVDSFFEVVHQLYILLIIFIF